MREFLRPPGSGWVALAAIHLAAALALGDDLQGLVSYDERLADAARLQGLVTAPA